MQVKRILGILALLAAGAAIPVIAQEATHRDDRRPPPPGDQRQGGPQDNRGGPRDDRGGPRDTRGERGGERGPAGPGGERGPGGPQRFQMPIKMEKTAYLGVALKPADDTLQEQLGLPRGVGLVVEMVDKDGPASAAGFKPHDVVHKLNDQLVIDPHQLAVLVRMNKPGDAVEFTVIRAGKPTKLTAKLGEKEMPPLMPGMPNEFMNPFNHPMGGQAFHIPAPPPMGPGGPPDVDTLIFRGQPAPALTADYLEIHDGQRKITLTNKDGKRTLKAVDADNKTVFDGPVNTPEEIAKVPEDLRKWVGNVQRIMNRRPVPGNEPNTGGEPGRGFGGGPRGGPEGERPRDARREAPREPAPPQP